MSETAWAVTVVPQNIERLPLFHWRPGARMLAIGSRDGADFVGDQTADRNTFKRPLTSSLICEAVSKQKLDGVTLAWSATLREPGGVAVILEANPATLVVATPGCGDPDLLATLLPRVDAWLVLVTAHNQAALAQRILDAGRHVEVLIGLTDESVPVLDWSRAAAIHLCARRPAESDRLDQWVVGARKSLPASAAIYDDHHQHTDCRACGERLVWRHSGRSRIDAELSNQALRCRACNAEQAFHF